MLHPRPECRRPVVETGNDTDRKRRWPSAWAPAALAVGLLAGWLPPAGAADDPSSGAANATGAAGFIHVGERDLQKVIDEAPPHSTVLCDPNRPMTLSVPVRIAKPLTLRGLNARLPARLGGTPLVVVTAQDVSITDFELTGNGDSVSQDERAPLMMIGAGGFHVERGRFFNGSKDGLNVSTNAGDGRDIVGGVIRDIVGREVIRDTVSISGSGSDGASTGGRVRNVLVDNVRCYRSAKRGCVEVSDGTDHVTVRKVYAEDSVYGVDVQDHGQAFQTNRHVTIEDVFALRCKHALRTNNVPIGHACLTVRDITAQACAEPVQISNTDQVSLYNVRVIDHKGKGRPVYLRNCRGVSVRDVAIENSDHEGPAVLLEDCDAALLDGLILRGDVARLTGAVSYRIRTDRAYTGLRISNVLAPGWADAGILLEIADGKKGTLSDYLVSGNLARVTDRIRGPRGLIANNLP